MIGKNSHKVLKNYHLYDEFTKTCKAAILEAVDEILGSETKEKIIKQGLKKIHKFFPVEYVPFLQYAVEKNLKKKIYDQIYLVTKNNLKIKNNFYIDRTLNFRIHYPYEIEKKSKMTRQIYRCMNLANYNNVKEEYALAKNKSLNYKFDSTDIAKINYFKTNNESAYLHSPHKDTWFGHSTEGINLWWAITPVNELNGLMLFKDIYRFNIKHEKRPAYVKDKYNLGKVIVPSMSAGELLVFDPEILHASRLNTSDNTRIVISGRINEKKPKFYGHSKENKEPFWLLSEDVKNNIYNKDFVFQREKKNIVNIKKIEPKKNTIKEIILNQKIKTNKNYRLFKASEINKSKKILLRFSNFKIGLLKRSSKIFAFNAICPHLQFNLLNTDGDKNSLVCPGHGLKFNLKNGVSSCKKFKIKVFNVINKNGYYYLKT